MMRARAFAIIVLAAGCAATAGAASAADLTGAVYAKITGTCQSCHGVGGNSTSSQVPRLNGQSAAYIADRLKGFRDPTRQTLNAIHAMWDTANNIGDSEIPEIAKYYAAQTPTASAGSVNKLAREGAQLYASGGKDVPACQACHGLHGEGTDLAPRLAGQHGAYLDYQLTAFMVTMRDQGTMNHNSMYLSADQIKALVAYLAKD